MFEVIKNVGVPENAFITKAKYPWESMEVGDAFDFPCAKGDRKALGKVTASAACYQRRHGLKFCTRRIDEVTVRCIRIA